MLKIIAIALFLTECITCTGTIWELRLMPDDVVVSFGDLTQDECEALKAEIQDQAPQWKDLVCVEVRVSRQDI